MSLPFEVEEYPKPIKLDLVYGVKGPVYVRGWTPDEFDAIQPTLKNLKADSSGVDAIRQIVANVLVNKDGTPSGATAEDLRARLSTPMLADLLDQVAANCGLAKPENIEKN